MGFFKQLVTNKILNKQKFYTHKDVEELLYNVNLIFKKKQRPNVIIR